MKYRHPTQNQLVMSKEIHLYMTISPVYIFFYVGLFQHMIKKLLFYHSMNTSFPFLGSDRRGSEREEVLHG